MKALVKYASGEGNVELREVEEPRCGDSEVKLEIAYCGICGTDLHVLHDTFRNYPPVILGHEFSGTVVEVGRKVTNATVGERVAGLALTPLPVANASTATLDISFSVPVAGAWGTESMGRLPVTWSCVLTSCTEFPKIFRWMKQR